MTARTLILSSILFSTICLYQLVSVLSRASSIQVSALSEGTTIPATQLPTMVSDEPQEMGFQYLIETMDRCHMAFWVYIDLGDPCNHFVVPAFMGNGVSIENGFTETVHSGYTAISNTFRPMPPNWGGVIYQNGVLIGDDTAPLPNWGEYENAGITITGASNLTFWARGEAGGEKVEFFAFGVGRDGWGNPIEPHPDSSKKVTMCGIANSPIDTCYVTLTNTWQMYTITLAGLDLDLDYVLGGFGWVTNANENNGETITFYLDDVQYDLSRPDDLRMLRSFDTLPTGSEFDEVNKNVAFLYDNALALIALTDGDYFTRATLLADAFVYAQQNDRFFDDGRLRNAYQAGDLVLWNGWVPNGRTGTARMPGWWNRDEGAWSEVAEHVGSGTGNLAWAMIALLNYYEKWGGDEYLTATITLGNWIELHTYDSRGAGGYTGGYGGWEPDPTQFMWKSTEHNLDLYVAFARLYEITGNGIWQARAQHALIFIEAMWNEDDGFYWTGTGTDGVTINEQAVPLDGQTWSLMAFGVNANTQRAVSYGEIHHSVSCTYTQSTGDIVVFEGFDFNEDVDQPWPEGIGQMVVSYWLLGATTDEQHYLDELRELQATHFHANNKGIVASCFDGLTTGFDWEYFPRLHVGATSWYLFGELRHNPYWPQMQPPVSKTEEIYLPMIMK